MTSILDNELVKRLEKAIICRCACEGSGGEHDCCCLENVKHRCYPPTDRFQKRECCEYHEGSWMKNTVEGKVISWCGKFKCEHENHRNGLPCPDCGERPQKRECECRHCEHCAKAGYKCPCGSNPQRDEVEEIRRIWMSYTQEAGVQKLKSMLDEARRTRADGEK